MNRKSARIASVAAGLAAFALVVLPGAAANASIASPVHSAAATAHRGGPAPASLHTLVITPAAGQTSEFTVYSGLNFGNTGGRKPVVETGCGNHNFPFALKSYVWVGFGQSGTTFNVKGGAGKAQTTFSGNSRVSSGQANGWESITINC